MTSWRESEEEDGETIITMYVELMKLIYSTQETGPYIHTAEIARNIIPVSWYTRFGLLGDPSLTVSPKG